MSPLATYPLQAQRRRRRRAALLTTAALPLTILLLALIPVKRPARPQVSAFAHGPADWSPAPRAFAPCAFTFHPDQMHRPTEAQIARWRAAYRLVRPIPYPYFAGVSVPSDCCGSFLSDQFYIGNLLSRRFGLDCPSSFWVFECQPNPISALFLADHAAPTHGPVKLEGDTVDRVALLLTYYYRGWLDHLHQWSGEGCTFYSVITPRTVAVDASGACTQALELGSMPNHLFLGLELGFDIDAGVHAFELELIDSDGVAHYVVYGRDLAGRPGWDLSQRSRDELHRVYVHLHDEQHRPANSTLGQHAKLHWQAARVSVWGTPGATLALRQVRPFDLSRAIVRQHIDALRKLNLLPICTTNHGGLSSWSQLDNWNYPFDFQDPVTGHKFHLDRPGLGATPDSPSYCGDLLDEFGIVFHNQVGGTTPADRKTIFTTRDLLRVWTRSDGRKMYVSARWYVPPTKEHPDVTPIHYENFENVGGSIARYLARYDEFGQHWIVYTHRNFFSPEVFTPPSAAPCSISEIRRLHPHQEQAFQTLACLKYDLDGKRAFHQRVWCCPLSVALRFAQAQRGLVSHARRDGNDVYITPWRDEVTGQPCPDVHHLSQDLHGQTFYVSDAASARVYCDGVEITSLRRNPPDFTGRPSVSIVDTETPTLLFDKVPLEQSGTIALDNARLAYPDGEGLRGMRCMQLTCDAASGAAVWTPRRLDNHETDYVHLSYRKSNPAAIATFAWTDDAGREYVVTEEKLHGRAGWEIGPHTGSGYREVVLEYADMRGPAVGDKSIPRGAIKQVRFAMDRARRGDTVCFDRVEFLSARGVRVDAGGGLVLGGRLSSRADGVIVQARAEGRRWQTTTAHGGWYVLQGVPRDCVVEIGAIIEGQRFVPERGRRVQAVRNDLEYHIDTNVHRRSQPSP